MTSVINSAATMTDINTAVMYRYPQSSILCQELEA